MIPVSELSQPRLRWRPAPGWPSRLGMLLVLGTAAAIVLWTELPLCPTATLFGVPCPGCGLTRASLLLLQGNVVDAARLHPLVFVLLPVVAGATLWGGASYLFGLRSAGASLGQGRAISVAAGLLFAALISVWALRFAGFFGGPAPVERSLTELRR